MSSPVNNLGSLDIYYDQFLAARTQTNVKKCAELIMHMAGVCQSLYSGESNRDEFMDGAYSLISAISLFNEFNISPMVKEEFNKISECCQQKVNELVITIPNRQLNRFVYNLNGIST